MINTALIICAAVSSYEITANGSAGAILLFALCVAGLLIYNR